MSESRRRLVQGPNEEALLKQAQALKIAGQADPQLVYGNTAPQSFNLAADMQAMEDLMPEVDVIQSQVQPISSSDSAPEQSSESEKERKDELSDDPIKRSEQIAEHLQKMSPSAPNAETLRRWKQMHKEIYITQIEENVFVYRYLKRQEDIQMKANPQIGAMTQAQINEMLFDKCVLWPAFGAVEKAMLPCGAIDMINDQIKLRSLYLDPQFVAQITLKL